MNHVPAQYKDEGSKRIRNALYIWNHIETDEALPESEPNQFLSNRLSAEQRHAVSKVGVSKYNLVLGPAGTGKTTIIPSILTAYNIPPNKVLIAAFTGRAVEILRQKLPNRYHNSVMTVHKSLKYQEGSGFRRGYNNVIPDIEWLFVDEIGILQFYVFARLLQSIPEHTRIVMLGDERQLSSRDGENLAYDLQMVRNINVLHLAENHRSNDVVLAAAHDVLRGRLPPYEPINIKQLATLALEGWQVITNVKRVSNEVNVAVLSRLPSRVPIELRNGFYAVGDRIMFKHNDYHYGFRNGEIGTIGSHDGLGNLFIRTPHKLYELPLDLLIRYPVIEHGYANTVNKFQGSEFDRVAIAIADLRVDLDEKNAQVSQNLLYTALTRAKYEFALFADDEAIELCRHRDMRSPVMDWARDSIEHCARIGVPINATFAEMVAKIDENCAE